MTTHSGRTTSLAFRTLHIVGIILLLLNLCIVWPCWQLERLFRWLANRLARIRHAWHADADALIEMKSQLRQAKEQPNEYHT